MQSPLQEQLQQALGDAYRLERELPRGGMSRLFLATERTLRRPVVIKLLPSELTSEASARRFRREIELAGQLRHPYILPVHSAGTLDGLLYYVMPYVAGESLRTRLDRERRLAIHDALKILLETSDALGYAHSVGVVHRDIKPANVLLEHGHAVLADFGIARALAENGGDDAVTRSGFAIGTPGYMAPEQAAGERTIDPRADVYALGVVGYEMLAGVPPFTAASARELLTAHLTRSPRPLSEVRPEVPPPLAEALHRALEKAPHDRYRTAAELHAALAAGGEGRGGASRATTRIGSLLRSAWRAATGASPVPTPTAPSRPTAARPTSDRAIAVLPFTVRGDPKLAYLGEGLVDLLATKLDGAGGFCVADPRAVLGLTRQFGERALDPDRARAVARQLGTGMFTLGSLVEAGGRLQLSATLYETAGDTVGLAQASQSAEGQIFEMVDELAIQLLAVAGRDGDAARVTRIAAATTHSLAALRCYLEGESLFRRGRFLDAKDAFQRAVDADPSFALAWYRLSMAAEWAGEKAVQEQAAEEALHRSGKLAEHDRQLVAAFVAWRRGDPAAERLYRSIIASHPADVEAWFQLGEVLFHYGPLTGRSLLESREAWERVLEFEPSHIAALHHLAIIAAMERRSEELIDLTRRADEVSAQGERVIELQALRAFALRDELAQELVLRRLTTVTDSPLLLTARTLAIGTADADAALAVARLATDRSRPAEIRTIGHIQSASLHIARGAPGEAAAELDAAAALDPILALEMRAFHAIPPFAAASSGALDDLRRDLEAIDTEVPDRESPVLFVRVHNGVHGHLRAYLLGLIAAVAGEKDEAERWASMLDGLGRSRVERTLGRRLAAGVRAELLRRHSPGEALALLERQPTEMSYAPTIASPFYSGARERFLRGELLAEVGRVEEARRWFGSFGEVSVYDLPFLTAARERQMRDEAKLGAGDRAPRIIGGTADARSAIPSAF